MRVPGRAHKRPKLYRATAVVIVVLEMRLRPPSLNCGSNCMTMMNTHRPIAVSMVAGRVRRTGVGLFARRSSDMTDLFQNCFVKTTAGGPEYWAKPSEP